MEGSQATLATRVPPQTSNSSQAGRQVHTGASPQVVLNSQVNPRASPHTDRRQADNTLSQAESTVFQAFLTDSTLPQAESMVSQAGNPQAGNPETSPAGSTLSQAGSDISQASNHQAAPKVRHSARLRASHASPNSSSQAGSFQAGNTPLADSAVSQQDSKASQMGSSQTGASQMTSSTSPPEAGSCPLPNRPNSPQGSSSKEEPNLKWVINLSSKPLTKAQRSVLAKGPNFVVSPKHLPNLEYITAIESACTKLSQQDAEEVRADINWVLWASHPPSLT